MLSDGYSEMAREKHGRLLIVDDEVLPIGGK